MRVIQISGASGIGKTTFLEEVIRQANERGVITGAVKHTHHALEETRRGDTERFLSAGAAHAVLAANGQAIEFTPDRSRRFSYEHPEELVRSLAQCELIVVEGFKSVTLGAPAQVPEHSRAPDEARKLLDGLFA